MTAATRWPRALPRALRRRLGVALCDAPVAVGDLLVVDDGPRCTLRRVGDLRALGIAATGTEMETLWRLPGTLHAQLRPLLPPAAFPLRPQRRGRRGDDRVALVVPLQCTDLRVLEQALRHHLDEGGCWHPAWLVVTAVVAPGAVAGATLLAAHRLRRAPVPQPLRGPARWRLLPFGADPAALPFTPRRGEPAQPSAATGPSLRSRSK